jgi:hypothetical protein
MTRVFLGMPWYMGQRVVALPDLRIGHQALVDYVGGDADARDSLLRSPSPPTNAANGAFERKPLTTGDARSW